ncbi:S8 family peptidase [Herbaspirillum huttiense]|uniref:S8 family peptidase n=1 Tax=Herbaspirillum huttiense TaxID=863372 RepID=UPI0031DDA521
MAGQFKHLKISKEELTNSRRTRDMKIPGTKRADLYAHGQSIKASLERAVDLERNTVRSSDDRFILKLRFTGLLQTELLQKHGVEFVSQENNELCIVFADEKGLSQFSDHLARLGKDDDLTYKQILTALESVDHWTRADRTTWAIEHYGLPTDDIFRLDVELWPIFSLADPRRTQLCAEFEAWLAARKIVTVDKINRDSLLLYRLEVNKEGADLLFEHTDVRFVDLLPRSGILYSQLNVDLNDIPAMVGQPNDNSARVCILDSGLNTNHPLLRSIVGDNVSFIPGQEADDEVGHGTAVAGIVAYGDVEACVDGKYWNPEFWILSGKILFRDPHTGEPRFEEKTIESTLANAVEYFVTQHQCKIFNLSIGNLNAPYDSRHIKGIAYLLDCLAREHDVLFVVSAGNFNGSELPPIPENSWRTEYPSYLQHQASTIIDPAPALNVLTVGSIARHNAHANEQRYPDIYALSPAGEGQPSPFTRHGPSVKGAFKPDLVATGGNLASPVRNEGKEWQKDARGMGVLTFNNDFVGNNLLKEISGTSFAAPYITHLAGRLLNEYPAASSNLLRAMLVNHAGLPHEASAVIPDVDDQRHLLGYGAVDIDSLFRSSDSVVVLHAEDSIAADSHTFYELPLPASFLRSQRASREIRVSLAHTPAVRTTRLDYVATKIFFRLVKGESLEQVQRSFNNDLRNETETRNDDSTQNREVTAQARGRGTVQASYWRLRQLGPNQKWFVVITRQDRDWGAHLSKAEEKYALVVTVTDRENADPQLYAEISARIQEQERARDQIRQRAQAQGRART